MPNPKNKTLIKDVKDAEKFPTNSINLKSEREKSIIHTVTGKLSQKDNEIEENMKTILESIGLKMITKAYIKSTMSPSVKLSI